MFSQISDRPKVAQWAAHLGAKAVCRIIPASCPFEQDVVLFSRTIGRIPPLCKLNPLYEQFVGLRFQALCYLADHPDI